MILNERNNRITEKMVAHIVLFLFMFSNIVFTNCLQCPNGHFHLAGMTSCYSWLTCLELREIDVKELIGLGAVKSVYKASWNGLSIAYSKLNNPLYADDFMHGLNMLKAFQPEKYIIKLVGFCEEKHIILTEYHQNGNAVNITNKYPKLNLQARLKLCLNYALILEYLHNSPLGIRVMCDSNDLNKLLSQLLVADDLTLILNDLDALPEVNREINQTIKCGHRELTGNFVAPEQLWPFSYSFNDSIMPGYDEKTDIWKAASLCNYFLGDSANSDLVKYSLFSVHKSCKNLQPEKRPTAKQLVEEYGRVLAEVIKDEL